MEKDKINETLSITLGAVSIVAIIGLVVNSKFDTNELWSAIINFTQVAIPVLVLFVARALQKDSKSFQQIGRDALVKLQKKYANLLFGPTYTLREYNPEKGNGWEYLFVKRKNAKNNKKIKLIAVPPLMDGVLILYIQPGTLFHFLNYKTDELTTENVEKIQNAIRTAVWAVVNKKYSKFIQKDEEAENNAESQHSQAGAELREKKGSKQDKDIAIQIDFDENRMKKDKFSLAIIDCAETALKTLDTFKRP